MTLAGRLAALGFADTATASRLLTEDLRLADIDADGWLLGALAGAADPDLALAGFARMAPEESLLGELDADAGLRARLFAVLGVSAALAEHLRRHRADWRLLTGSDAAGGVPAPAAAAGRAGPDRSGAAR
jgi:glutamate-ammonia-ligase adenylyltransferase